MTEPNDRERKLIDTGQTLEQHIAPAVEQLEREYLEEVLRENEGRIVESAEQAGVSRRTLLRKLKTYHIDKADFKS